MKMRKVLALVLALVLTLSLAACGGKTETPATQAPAATNAPASNDAPAATEAPATQAPAATEAGKTEETQAAAATEKFQMNDKVVVSGSLEDIELFKLLVTGVNNEPEILS